MLFLIGQFYVTTGMLKLAGTETELLNMLAHEIYYVDKGLINEALINQFGGNTLGEILLGEQTTTKIDEMADYLSLINYSEELVIKADSFAVDVICPFLFDPLGIPQFLERMQNSMNQPMVSWLDNRPTDDTTARIERIFERASECGDFGKKYETRYRIFKESLP